MSTSLFQRLSSMTLSVLLTMAMLGGIDSLSQHPVPAEQWAQQTSHRA